MLRCFYAMHMQKCHANPTGCSVPSFGFSPHFCTEAQTPRLIPIQLAICGQLQQNQLWYFSCQPDTDTITTKLQDLLLKTKVNFRVCRNLFPLPHPTLSHNTLRLIFTFKPSCSQKVLLTLSQVNLTVIDFPEGQDFCCWQIKLNIFLKKNLKWEIKYEQVFCFVLFKKKSEVE